MGTLGIYLDLDENNRDRVKYMRTKALTWETSIQAKGIQKDGSWHALKLTTP